MKIWYKLHSTLFFSKCISYLLYWAFILFHDIQGADKKIGYPYNHINSLSQGCSSVAVFFTVHIIDLNPSHSVPRLVDGEYYRQRSWLEIRLINQSTMFYFFFLSKIKMEIFLLLLIITTQKMKFPLRISSVNVTKSARNYRFGHIYWRNP